LCLPAAQADEARKPRHAYSTGTDITGNSLFGYAGGVWAFGNPLDEPGLRIKALGGFGDYAYDGTLPLAGGSVPARFNGEVFLAELLLGRMWQHEQWTVKLYGGVEYVDHRVSPRDASNPVRGSRWGAKVKLESWRNIGARAFLSLDASYGTAFDDYWILGRLGRSVGTRLSGGIEAGALGNEGYDTGRAGAFLRYRLKGAEITLSGGATGDYLEGDPSGYVTLGLYARR